MKGNKGIYHAPATNSFFLLKLAHNIFVITVLFPCCETLLLFSTIYAVGAQGVTETRPRDGKDVDREIVM